MCVVVYLRILPKTIRHQSVQKFPERIGPSQSSHFSFGSGLTVVFDTMILVDENITRNLFSTEWTLWAFFAVTPVRKTTVMYVLATAGRQYDRSWKAFWIVVTGNIT